MTTKYHLYTLYPWFLGAELNDAAPQVVKETLILVSLSYF